KGFDDLQMAIGAPRIVDFNFLGKRIRRGMRYWPVGVSVIKSELYALLNLEKPTDGNPYPEGYCHYPQYGEEYFQQLTAEEIRRRFKHGHPIYYWEKIRERNEALDCHVYNRAAAAAFGIDRFGEAEWSALEEQLGVPATPKPLPAAAPSQPASQ